MITEPYAAAQASAANLARLTGCPSHDIAVVLGSGFAPAADELGTTATEIPLTALGGFPAPTVPGAPGAGCRARRAHRRRRWLQDHRADERMRRDQPGPRRRRAGADQ